MREVNIAIGYIRVYSESDEENQKSAKRQLEQIKKYCQLKGLVLGPVFADRHRPDCQCNSTLIAKAISAMLCSYELARHFVCIDKNKISKDNLEYLEILLALECANVRLHLTDGVYPDEKSLRKLATEVMKAFPIDSSTERQTTLN